MTNSGQRKRSIALTNLLELRQPLSAAIAAVRNPPWDSDVEIAFLTGDIATFVMERYLVGEVTPTEIEHWADTIEGRDDIGFDAEDETLLKGFIFDLANPELSGPISPEVARRWISVLGGKHVKRN